MIETSQGSRFFGFLYSAKAIRIESTKHSLARSSG